MKQWKTRPEQDDIRCPYQFCAHGMGQAGTGRCPGDWTDPNCKEFITDKDFGKQMKEECNEK